MKCDLYGKRFELSDLKCDLCGLMFQIKKYTTIHFTYRESWVLRVGELQRTTQSTWWHDSLQFSYTWSGP